MQLESVDIRDYRSIFADELGSSLSLTLAEGMTTLVGRNNCGKSNVLRAISLALDPNHPYSPADDSPGPRPFAHPVITLGFRVDLADVRYGPLLNAVERYEESLGVSSLDVLARQGIVRLRVSFVPLADGVERREILLVADGRTPTTSEQRELLATALELLRASVRFVLISSGESIESVLEGNLREILHSVVRERLHDAFDEAEASRRGYITGLQERLLAPLRERMIADVVELFPEIGGVELAPEVSSIEQTLARVGVNLDDVVSTPLAGKGTGVRGGVLVAMLSYLALNATRGMVFALEEPEAFLHPGAQEQLRDRLDDLACTLGVTLIVTSHSPFIASRSARGRVVCLAKDREGRTRVGESAAGDADHAPLVGSLLGETTLGDIIASASAIPVGTKAVVLLEGEGDRLCFERTAAAVGRPDLLDGIWLRPAGTAAKVVLDALISREATKLPVIVVVDNDESGRLAKDRLTGSSFDFPKKNVITYATLFDQAWQNFPVEAEDVFEPSLLQAFVDEHGLAITDGHRRRPDGANHYDFGQAAKLLIDTWLAANTKPEHVERWIELILRIRKQVGLSAEETAADIVSAAVAEASTTIETGRALIVAGQHDFARYGLQHALLLNPDLPLPAELSHVGFYTSAAIQPVVPAIEADHPHLLFDATTAAQLAATGSAADARVAKLIDDAVAEDAGVSGQTFRVLLLTGPDDPRTITLDSEIKNTKTAKNGAPLAWTVGPKAVAIASLVGGPTTTSELDELIAKEAS